MIDHKAIAYLLGHFLLALAGTMLIPLGFALWEPGDALRPLAYGVVTTTIAGGLLVALLRRHAQELTRREALLLVVGAWVSVCFFGSLPFLFSPYFSGLTDAFFESVSGFTTTGATVLDQVEILPRPLQFWRCFTHWIGGMGIILLGIAILPLLGHGGMELYRAEFSGAKSEKLKPRIVESAQSLLKIYLLLSVAEFAALRWAGMNSFEALCHTFSTLGTGGFSTRTASIAGFNSPTIEFIILIFMLLAGMSFIQHYHLWIERRPRNVLSDAETRKYVVIFVTASIVICLVLIGSSGYAPAEALRSSFFQVGSILTTTGFVTDDFESWLPLPQLILLALMFVGGCTGSTAGGLKVMRIVLLPRVVYREFRRMVERRGVFAVRLNGHAMQESTIQSLLNLVYIAFVVNFVSCCLLTATGVDVLTSISAVAASMFNIGPGLGGVGPLENYASLPALAKWVLTVCMIAGRLEFFTVLVVFTPSFWRK